MGHNWRNFAKTRSPVPFCLSDRSGSSCFPDRIPTRISSQAFRPHISSCVSPVVSDLPLTGLFMANGQVARQPPGRMNLGRFLPVAVGNLSCFDGLSVPDGYRHLIARPSKRRYRLIQRQRWSMVITSKQYRCHELLPAWRHHFLHVSTLSAMHQQFPWLCRTRTRCLVSVSVFIFHDQRRQQAPVCLASPEDHGHPSLPQQVRHGHLSANTIGVLLLLFFTP